MEMRNSFMTSLRKNSNHSVRLLFLSLITTKQIRFFVFLLSITVPYYN